MGRNGDPNIAKMAEDAKQCEQRGEFAEALDFYEEIDRLGESRPETLTAMGNCYMHTRQRQNARQVWLRAFEMNPNHKPAVELLDRYFQGWEKTIASAPAHKAASPPPPPPPPGGRAAVDQTKLSISFESVPPPPPPDRTAISPSREPAEETVTADDIFNAAAQRTMPRQAPPPPQPERSDRSEMGRPPARPVTQTQRPLPAQPPSRSLGHAPAAVSREKIPVGQLPAVNWDFVMADAMTEADRRR